MVDTVILAGLLVRRQISCIFHDHDRLVVSCIVLADRAELIVCQRKTFFTVSDVLPCIDDRIREPLHFLDRTVNNMKRQAGKKTREAGLSQRNGRGGAESDGKGSLPAYQKNAAGTMKKTAAKNPVNHNTPLSGREKSLPAGDVAVPVSSETMQNAGVLTNQEAKEKFKRRQKIKAVSETPKIHPGKNEIAVPSHKVLPVSVRFSSESSSCCSTA